MKQRLITLIAVTALLIGGAVPALAGKPDNPGNDRGASAEHIDVRGEDNGDEDGDRRGPPDGVAAYGWRIKDAYGLPFGLLLQCNPDFVPDTKDEDAKVWPTCEEALAMGDGATLWELGASAFWATNQGLFLG